jgi:hypothetical protein
MRDISTAALATLTSGRAQLRGLVRAYLASGSYAIWDGSTELVYEGVTYYPNGLVSIDPISGTTGIEAEPITIRLSVPRGFGGLTPDAFSDIESETYKGRRITVASAWFDPDTRAILDTETWFDGIIDKIDHVSDANSFGLECKAESENLGYHRRFDRSASHADQQLIAPGDKFLRHASAVKYRKIRFGAS